MPRIAILAALALVATLSACEKKPAPSTARPAAHATLPASFFLTAEPTGAKPVEEARAAAKQGDTIAIRGRIGGSEKPFVDDRAVFTIVGPGIPACADKGDDHCQTPWDYCCEQPEDVVPHSATIQVVDEKGALLRTTIKGQSGVKELADVIVVGKVAQATPEVFVIHATGIFIAKQ